MQKQCPKCQSPHHLDALWCPCGHQFKTRFVPNDQTQAFGASPVGVAQAGWNGPFAQQSNTALIIVAWSLFAATILLSTSNATVAILCLLGAFGCAIGLLSCRSKTDKSNGVSIILSVACLLAYTVFAAMPSRPAGSPQTAKAARSAIQYGMGVQQVRKLLGEPDSSTTLENPVTYTTLVYAYPDGVMSIRFSSGYLDDIFVRSD